MAKKKALPVWAQIGLVWVVLTVLGAFGVLYLRATERIGDGVFQPLVRILCSPGDRLDTSYRQTTRIVRPDGGITTSGRGRVQQIFQLDQAVCVPAAGPSRPATGFVPAVLLLFGAAMGLLLAVAWRFRRRPLR